MASKVDTSSIHSLTIEHTVYYAVHEPVDTKSVAPMLLALHGYGQNCRRFIRDFSPLRDRGVLVVAPQAPNQFYFKYDPPVVGCSWLTSNEKADAIHGFLGYMKRLCTDVEGRYRTDVARPFLLGFSQGVSMAYRFAAKGGIHPAGLVACCADLPLDVEELLPSLNPFPVLLVHGMNDPLISIEKSYSAERVLRAHGFHVNTCYFEGGHFLEAEHFTDIAEWITAIHSCGAC